MEKLPIFLTLAAAGAWTGAILFHSAVVAPATFKVLDGDNAGIFLRRLFPSFFRFGLVCGGLMLAGLVANAAISDSIRAQALALTVVMCILQAICLGMVPAINAARDQGERGKQRFGRLHLVNVLLTVAVLGLGLVVIYLLIN
ncbi:MAG: DUF4149 domain-containing protein [Woeseiaceae bacterium]|nr:DUF4149 domain-containing protein [Woeseiaceae bacterium]